MTFYSFLKFSSALLGGGGIFLAIILSEQRYAAKQCQKVHIVLQPPSGQQFITEEKILSLITASGKKPILNTLMKSIQTNELINILQGDHFVKNVVMYKTWQGVLKIMVVPKKALARVIVKGSVDHQYIEEEGDFIPMSPYHTARVPLVEVDGSENVVEIKKELLILLKYICEDTFLRAQITYMRVEKSGKTIMYPRIGKQVIEFGKLVCIAKKCTKLKHFYNAVIPRKGWNAYSRVNLEFDNQIVCK